MNSTCMHTQQWAEGEVAAAQLGDVRRVPRVSKMLQRSAEHPHGRLSVVFVDKAERQAAYDLLEDGNAPLARCYRTGSNGSRQPCEALVSDRSRGG